jgi:predicted ferric reductase
MPARLGWERWRFGHDVLAPLFLSLVFGHSILIGGDLRPLAMQVMWVGVLAAAFALFVWHRVLKPAALARRPYEVVGVKEEAPGVWTVALAPPAGEKRFDYLPGQFQFLTLERGRGLPREEHHFTVSSSPTLPDVVTSTIKELGDFTATVKETRVGDRAVVDAPYGRFSYLHHPDERALCFVAGGIGITPIMSMLRHLRDTKSELAATLFYGNHDASQIVFRDELEELARGERPRLRLVHVLADPPEGWTGERGRIDAAVLRKYLPDDLSAFGFYLCGPSGLVSSTVKNLRRLGVAYSRIHVEIFSFLD